MAFVPILLKVNRPAGRYAFGSIAIPDLLPVGTVALAIDRSSLPNVTTIIATLELDLSWDGGTTWGVDFLSGGRCFSGRHRIGISGGVLRDRLNQVITNSLIKLDRLNLPSIPNRRVRGALVLDRTLNLDLRIEVI